MCKDMVLVKLTKTELNALVNFLAMRYIAEYGYSHEEGVTSAFTKLQDMKKQLCGQEDRTHILPKEETL